MRVILDPHVALVLERSRPTVLSPEEALRRMHGVKGVTVALTDVSVPDSVQALIAARLDTVPAARNRVPTASAQSRRSCSSY